MRLGANPEVEKFQAEFAAFLDEHLPTAAEASERTRSSSHIPEWSRRWQRMLFDTGWLLPGQPPEYGGRNATFEQVLAHQEELSRLRSEGYAGTAGAVSQAVSRVTTRYHGEATSLSLSATPLTSNAVCQLRQRPRLLVSVA